MEFQQPVEGQSLNLNLIRPDNPAAAATSRSRATDADIVLSPDVRSVLGDGELSPLRRAAFSTSRQPGCRRGYYGSLGKGIRIGNGAHYERGYRLCGCALHSCVKRSPWYAGIPEGSGQLLGKEGRGALERDFWSYKGKENFRHVGMTAGTCTRLAPSDGLR